MGESKKVPARYEYKHPWRRAAKKSVLWGEWVAVMIAALVAVVVGILSGLLGVEDPRNQVYLAAAVFMILGVGDLVRVRYRLQIAHQQTENVALHFRVEELEADIAILAVESQEPQKPTESLFSLELLGGRIYMPTNEPTLTGFALDARIHNTGAPSYATNWALTVILPGGTSVPAHPAAPPPILRLPGGPAIPQADFSLEDQTRNVQLQREVPPVQSKILFHAEIPRDDVLASDTFLELSVEDMDGRRVSTQKRMGDWLTREQG